MTAVDQEQMCRHFTGHTSSCRDLKDRRLPDRASSGRPISIATAFPSVIDYAPKVNIFASDSIDDVQAAGVARRIKA